MPIRDFPAETIIQRMYCDAPNCEGEVLPTGSMDMETETDKIMFEHRCQVCEHTYHFDTKYPTAFHRALPSSYE